MKSAHRHLYAAAGLLSALGSSTLWAQAASPGANVELEEIIVTAEKREENLQKTPIAVTALGGDELVQAGVSQPEDLNKMVPGLGIAQGGPSTQVYVRGVGNYATNAFADPAVAFNMDGVYISRFSGLSGNFFDVSRLEVLKGPQGTLYGRNATGGAINIITNKPGKDFEGNAGIDIGKYNLIKVTGMANLPISDSVSTRFAFQSTNRDGYQTDGYDDDVSRAARLHLLIAPNDGFSLLLTGNYLQLGGKGPVHVPTMNTGFMDNGNPWLGQSVAMPIAISRLTAPPASLFGGVDRSNGKQDITVKSVSAQLDSNLGFGSLTALGNHMSNINDSKFYGPGFMVDTRTHSKQDSLEVRLSGDTGPIKWVGGLYYFVEKQSEIYWVDQGYLFNQTGVAADPLKDTTGAAFGQVTYSLTDRLRLTGGLRYTNEKKSQNGLIFGRQPQSLVCPSGTVAVSGSQIIPSIPQAATNGAGQSYPFTYCQDTMSGSVKWNDTSWKFGVDFDVADNSMVYASVSRGFKAGGYFAGGDHAAVPQPNGTIKTGNVYDPETLTAYAVGSKNRFLNNSLQLNGEAFYWDYKDHQESYLAPTSTAGTFNFVTQQADARIYGLDLDVQALLSDYDQLGARMEYLHAEYTDANFINASPSGASPRSACTMRQDATYPAIWYANCNGQQMPRSPEFSGSLDYQHTFPLPNGASVIPGVDAQYSSSYWSAVDYNPLQKQDSYVMWGANLMYEAVNKAWSVTAYGENLGNKVVYTNAFMYPGTNSIGNGGANNIAMVQLHAPRTYGVRFNANFK